MDLLSLLTRWKFDVDENPVRKLEHRLEGLQRRLEFLGAAEAIRGIHEITERFSAFAEQLQSGATSAGLTAEALQKIQFAGTQSAVSAEEMTGALARLSRQLHEARNGSAQALETFKQAGISPEQVRGFRTSADALRGLADRMQRIKDPIEKQGLAMALLGRGSHNMVGLLSKGSAAMDAMGKEALEVGAVLAGPQVQALAEVEDSLSKLWQVLKVFTAGIAARFAPAIGKAVDAFLELYKAHRKFIEVNISKWVGDITYAFGFVFGVCEGLIMKFTAFAEAHETLVYWGGRIVLVLGAVALGAWAVQAVLGILVGFFGLLGSAVGLATGPFKIFWMVSGFVYRGLILIIAQMGVLVARAFPQLGAAVVRFSSLLLATPLGWIIAGIAALVLGAELLYTMWFKKGSFKDTWLGQIYEGVKGAGSWVMDKLGFGKPSAEGGAANNMGALARMGPPGAGQAPDAESMMMQGMALQGNGSTPSYELTAPITINVPAGTDASGVGKAAREGVRDHLDRVLRETRRGLKQPVAY